MDNKWLIQKKKNQTKISTKKTKLTVIQYDEQKNKRQRSGEENKEGQCPGMDVKQLKKKKRQIGQKYKQRRQKQKKTMKYNLAVYKKKKNRSSC